VFTLEVIRHGDAPAQSLITSVVKDENTDKPAAEGRKRRKTSAGEGRRENSGNRRSRRSESAQESQGLRCSFKVLGFFPPGLLL